MKTEYSLRDMKNNIFFIITIDTEIDKSPNWEISPAEKFLSVLDGIPNKLSPLFYCYNAKPTYHLSPEVIENQECVDVIKTIENCELSTHLHGDLIEPNKTIYKYANRRSSEMQCSYPKEIEYKKLKNLTELFIEKFGYAPTSFRAGRFAAGTNTINSLERLGYLVDSSVTPFIDWNLPEGRANFLNASDQPYFPDKQDIVRVGDSKVLEVPVSIITSRFKKHFQFSNNVKLNKYLDIIANQLSPTYWLRPSFQSSQEMLYAIKRIIKKHHTKDIIVLNMMFHSMEIIPNASPYTKTDQDCYLFLRRIEDVLKYCVENNFQFATLSELYSYFKK